MGAEGADGGFPGKKDFFGSERWHNINIPERIKKGSDQR